jgi:hypothetical protein
VNRCRLLCDGGGADFVQGARGCSFTGVDVSGGSRMDEGEWVGDVSFRVIWAVCWVGFEAQRVVD